MASFSEIQMKKIEKKEKDSLYYSIFESTGSATLIVEEDGIISMANKECHAVTGYKPDELIGKLWMQFVSPESLPEMMKYHTLRRENPDLAPNKYEVRLINKKKEVRSAILKIGMIPESKQSIVSILDITYIKDVEKDLVLSEENFRNSVENSPFGIRIADLNGKTLFVNPAFLDLFDYNSIGEFNSTPFKKRYTPDSLEEHEKRKQLRKLGKEINEYEISIEQKNKKIKFIKINRKETVWNGLKHVQIINQDITELKRANFELLQAKKDYEDIFQAIGHPTFILNNHQEVLKVNKAAERLLQKNQEELIGKKCFQLCHMENSPPRGCPFQQMLNSQKLETFEMEMEVGDGWFLVSCTPVFDNDNMLVYVIHISTDITAQKKMNLALEENMKLLTDMTDNSNSLIYILDLEGRFVLINNELANLFGKTKDDIIGKTRLSFMPREIANQHYNNDLKVLELKTPITFEEGNIEPDGKHYYFTTKFPLIDSQNIIYGICGISTDITEHKKAELELIAAKLKAEESDRLKTAFIHNISHEIRTPMNAIMGFSSMLAEKDNDSQTTSSYINIINQSSNQLLSVINDLIEISNIEAGIIKTTNSEININELFRKLYIQYKEKWVEKKISFNLYMPLSDNEAIFITDNTKLVQILTNLINNAFKFTFEGNIGLGYTIDKEIITFYVSDTGIGIPEDQLTRIFDRFYQVNNSLSRLNEGTGLGLSITKSLVETLGGSITVESVVESGSKFSFTLPIIRPNKPGIIEHDNSQTFSINKDVYILIAEDDEASLQLISRYLENPKINLIKVTNGKDAYEYCKSGSPVDIVFMDLKMPVMDGFKAITLIRQLSPGLPIIAQTSFAYDNDKEKALSCGCNDYISKPFTKANILAKIQQYLYK